MEDRSGTMMCDDCAEDAMKSGLFSDEEPNGEEEEDDEDDETIDE